MANDSPPIPRPDGDGQDDRPGGRRVRVRLKLPPPVIRCIEKFVRNERGAGAAMPEMTGAGLSHPGRIRTNNEDDWRYEPALSVAIVADGMGGAACGEIASSTTVTHIINHLWLHAGSADPCALLVEAVKAANSAVLERARTEDGCRGMGSTVVAAIWNGDHLWIVNVGDSRAYLYRGNSLEQLSHDQTLLNEIRDRMQLNESQVANFPHKHVLTQAIGAQEDLSARTTERQLQPGDQILLCSDGLSGPVPDAEIAAIIGQPLSAESRVQQLVDAAIAAGGPDNVTAVLLSYSEQPI